MNGVRFYSVIWDCGNGKIERTTEAAHNRRYLVNQIKKKEIMYYNNDSSEWSMIKIQEIKTPMIEIEWLLNLFTLYGNKKEREAHREQAAYVLRLVENCAARVALENGDFIER